MDADSTRTDYVLKFLNHIFAGESLTVTPTFTRTALCGSNPGRWYAEGER